MLYCMLFWIYKVVYHKTSESYKRLRNDCEKPNKRYEWNTAKNKTQKKTHRNWRWKCFRIPRDINSIFITHKLKVAREESGVHCTVYRAPSTLTIRGYFYHFDDIDCRHFIPSPNNLSMLFFAFLGMPYVAI